MSREKLTVIVTCTDRKAATARPALMARHLPLDRVQTRARLWITSLAESSSRIPLIDLYRGETWSQVKRLVATAHSIGFETDVLVASAGLGLRRLDDTAPAYAATFTRGHPDSVAGSAHESAAWWELLPHAELTKPKCAMWVLSENYGQAIGGHLVEHCMADDQLVFGGANGIPDEVRVASDRTLRRALGGTTTSLNVRTAIQWLLVTKDVGPFGTRAEAAWHGWAEGARYREQYDRRPVSDSAVLEFVASVRSRDPRISKTRALRSLRDAGMACEQGRFSTLFSQGVTQ